MLTHSPPLPLTIWYTNSKRKMTAEDEEGALLALSHRERVHRIALCIPAPNLCKFIATMDEAYPILERICISSRPRDATNQPFPGTFEAPNLRHVWTTWRPIGSPLLTTAVGLVNLELIDIPSSPWSPPTYILTQLLRMPHLETLRIHFCTPHPNRDVGDVETSTMTHATLPNLHVFSFRGVSTYMEGFARIIAPTLSILDVQFFNQLTFGVPCLLQFIQASDSLSFSAVEIAFDRDFVRLMAAPDRSWRQCPLRLQIACKFLDWQVASAVQILDTLLPVLSGVEKLTLSHVAHNPSLHDEVDTTQWRKLFRPFSNLKTLCVTESLELLPNLVAFQGNVFTSFKYEREEAGYLVFVNAPTLGVCLRGPMVNGSGVPVTTGLVFGQDLKTCVRDTVIDVIRDVVRLTPPPSDGPQTGRTSPCSALSFNSLCGAVSLSLHERWLPALVVRCVEHLMKWGMEEEALFR
jgi:hypothetical protein